MEHLQRSANESEDDYIYRILGSYEWVYTFNAKDANKLPEGTLRDIWRMYCNFQNMTTQQIEEEVYENEGGYCYGMDTIGGAWCRTWCRMARKELDKRKPKISAKMLATMYRNAGFTVTEDGDGIVIS